MALKLVHSKLSWEPVEDAELSFRGISALLEAILNEVDLNSTAARAIEGVILLADAKSADLRHVIEG